MTDSPGARAPVLVIGVGSELRSDDAAGRRVADAVTALALSGVEVRSVHQLTPELAEEMTDRRLVIVVDAAIDVPTVRVRPVEASTSTGPVSHHLDVAALVATSRLLGTPPTEVQAVHVPVVDLALGTELSPTTSAAVRQATDLVGRLIDDHGSLAAATHDGLDR